MTSFFVCTEDSIAGPFSGIELREAALAGILRYEAIIGGSAAGPWFRAADVGLFSEKRMPLPHPPGTQTTTYQVRGLKVGTGGDYKLRELIGFAARGLLPSDAEIRPATSTKWFPVTQINILRATLTGELVLLDESGSIIIRTNLQTKLDAERRGLAHDSSENSETHRGSSFAPGEIAGLAQHTPKAVPLAPPIVDQAEAAAAELEAEQERVKRIEEFEQLKHLRQLKASRLTLAKIRQRLYQAICVPLVGKQSVIPWRKVTLGLEAILLVSGLVIAMVFIVRVRPTTRDQLVGDWIRDVSQPAEGAADARSLDERFVISFRPDGRFVLASATAETNRSQEKLETDTAFTQPSDGMVAQTGDHRRAMNSWCGNFFVKPAAIHSRPLASAAGMSQTIDLIDPSHTGDNVESTDGHVFLEGFLTRPPRIAGHTVTDFYVRSDGDDLLIGYPAEVRWRENETTLRAGWIRLKRMDIKPGLDVADQLRRIKPTENLERVPYGGVIEVPHVSEAVVIARTGREVQQDGSLVVRHACMAYSEEIDFWSMITSCGGPDEVRSVKDYELTSLFAELPEATLRGGRLLRYGDLTFAFSAQGELRYVVAADNSAIRR